tara:strand:+ start:1143 stop:1643 length:501 start_codon:yes stop_codon:yes gene_type:complete
MESEFFVFALVLAILLCTLVSGLLFGFAVVVMPGVAKLSDRDFLLAFKHMDGIIQNNQPLFILVWVGSILSVLVSAILGTMDLSGQEAVLLWIGCGWYLLGVQLPTIVFNIPLNNTIQALEIDKLNESELTNSRVNFEAKWNRWNNIRTINGIIAVSTFLYLLYLL